MTKLTFNPDDTLSPESKAEIIAEILRYMALRMEPVGFGTILRHVMTTFDAAEEQISADTQSAYFTLLRAELIISNDYDADNCEASIGAGTIVQPSKDMTALIWGKPAGPVDVEMADD